MVLLCFVIKVIKIIINLRYFIIIVVFSNFKQCLSIQDIIKFIIPCLKGLGAQNKSFFQYLISSII